MNSSDLRKTLCAGGDVRAAGAILLPAIVQRRVWLPAGQRLNFAFLISGNC